MFDKDDLELNPESEEDLDVGEEEGEDVAGGAGITSPTGTSTPKIPTGGSPTGPVGPVRPGGTQPGGMDPRRASTASDCTCNTGAQGCTTCATSAC